MTLPSQAENAIPVRWRTLLRIFWLALAALIFTLYFMGLKPYYVELNQLCRATDCPFIMLAPEELAIIQNYGLSLSTYAVIQLCLEGFLIITFSALAGLVFWRRSDTWMGFIISLAFLFIAMLFFAEEPRALARAYPALEPLVGFLVSISVVLVLILFYIFPDGQFAPKWMRWIAGAQMAAILLDPLVIQSSVQASSTSLFIVLIFSVGVPLGIVSQIYRFRKVSTPTQRQQTKWLLVGFLNMIFGMSLWLIFAEITPLSPGPARLIFFLSLVPQYFLIGLFPSAVVISIMRYRLWDIDLVIRRTLQYTLLTGLLALAYFGGVVIMQGILTSLTGSGESPLVTVLTTLGIAALFNPLRLRVQDFIDRRFYRKKYDAEQALAQFAVAIRDEVDMDHLAHALLSVVDETMQPEQVSLWLTVKDHKGSLRK